MARTAGLTVSATLNLGVADDFRVPDLGLHRGELNAVFLPTAALVGEILRPDDETWEKFPFYAPCGVDELLVVDYTARTMRLFALTGDSYTQTTRSEVLGQSLSQMSHISWPGKERG